MQIERPPAIHMQLHRTRILGLLFSLFIPVACLCQSPEPVETIRVDSDLVDLKVSVVNLNPQNPSVELQQKDFLVLEDCVLDKKDQPKFAEKTDWRSEFKLD